ncbi:hypothetical protein [Erwinia aphidicola]|uniref:hypothetical protein n=1 Tax=Erwinia aphidicola TaxID=68334 RepID=UPI003AB90E15
MLSRPIGGASGLTRCNKFNVIVKNRSFSSALHLIHGDDDSTLPLTHAVAAEARLTALGGDVTLDIVDDLPHAVDDRAMQLALDRLRFTVPRRYFDEALGGATPGEDDVIALM